MLNLFLVLLLSSNIFCMEVPLLESVVVDRAQPQLELPVNLHNNLQEKEAEIEQKEEEIDQEEESDSDLKPLLQNMQQKLSKMAADNNKAQNEMQDKMIQYKQEIMNDSFCLFRKTLCINFFMGMFIVWLGYVEFYALYHKE